MNDLKQIWNELKFQATSTIQQGGVEWHVELSDSSWAEIAKEFDKYTKESK